VLPRGTCEVQRLSVWFSWWNPFGQWYRMVRRSPPIMIFFGPDHQMPSTQARWPLIRDTWSHILRQKRPFLLDLYTENERLFGSLSIVCDEPAFQRSTFSRTPWMVVYTVKFSRLSYVLPVKFHHWTAELYCPTFEHMSLKWWMFKALPVKQWGRTWIQTSGGSLRKATLGPSVPFRIEEFSTTQFRIGSLPQKASNRQGDYH